MQELRLLQEKDLESIYPIYVYYVKTSTAIFDVVPDSFDVFKENQRIIAGNAQFAGIAAGRGVRFTTGLLLLGKGLGMRETPIRPHSWH